MAIAPCAAMLPNQKKQCFKIARFTDAPFTSNTGSPRLIAVCMVEATERAVLCTASSSHCEYTECEYEQCGSVLVS